VPFIALLNPLLSQCDFYEIKLINLLIIESNQLIFSVNYKVIVNLYYLILIIKLFYLLL